MADQPPGFLQEFVFRGVLDATGRAVGWAFGFEVGDWPHEGAALVGLVVLLGVVLGGAAVVSWLMPLLDAATAVPA